MRMDRTLFLFLALVALFIAMGVFFPMIVKGEEFDPSMDEMVPIVESGGLSCNTLEAVDSFLDQAMEEKFETDVDLLEAVNSNEDMYCALSNRIYVIIEKVGERRLYDIDFVVLKIGIMQEQMDLFDAYVVFVPPMERYSTLEKEQYEDIMRQFEADLGPSL